MTGETLGDEAGTRDLLVAVDWMTGLVVDAVGKSAGEVATNESVSRAPPETVNSPKAEADTVIGN